MGLPLPVVVEETATLTSATLLLHDSPAPCVKGVLDAMNLKCHRNMNAETPCDYDWS